MLDKFGCSGQIRSHVIAFSFQLFLVFRVSLLKRSSLQFRLFPAHFQSALIKFDQLLLFQAGFGFLGVLVGFGSFWLFVVIGSGDFELILVVCNQIWSFCGTWSSFHLFFLISCGWFLSIFVRFSQFWPNEF